MRTYLLLYAARLLFSIVGLLFSVSSAAAITPALWQVELAQGRTAYLFGTLHVGRSDFYPLPQPLSQALASHDCLVMELALNDAAELQATAKLTRELGFLPRDQRLQQLLPAPLYQQALASGKRLGLLPVVSERMQPWMLAVSLQVAELMRMGYQPALGLDSHLSQQAAQLQQRIVALETGEAQLRLFATRPEYGVELLRQSLMAEQQQAAERMLNAWQSGDLPTLAALSQDACTTPVGKQLMAELLDGRNRQWAGQLQQLWAQQPCNVAVGALHLVGENNLLQLLQQAGYSIQRVTYHQP